jgi:hypothetical protein
MIAIQIILIFGFLLFLWRFLSDPASHRIHAWIKILTALFTVLAVIVVAFPNISNDVAHAVGVTTGANLLLYFLTLAFIFVVVNLYIRNKTENERLVALVRKIAILEAQIAEKDKKSTGKHQRQAIED